MFFLCFEIDFLNIADLFMFFIIMKNKPFE